MSKEKEKSGLRVAQVVAAALAAVTAALLGSTLGVAGTVLGAGVASVITTVGGELYLRSLHGTRKAALRAREVWRREDDLSEQPTVVLERPDVSAPGRKLRWPLIIGTSVAAFAVALLAIVGFESATGAKVGGGTGPALGKILGGSGHHSTPETPASEVAPTPSSVPTTTPTTPTTTPSSSTPTPTTSPTTPTSTTPPTSSATATPTATPSP